MGEPEEARRNLVRLLRKAYSGELAAARAYRGHARSVSDPEERSTIERIEREELDHRQRVGRILTLLGMRPSPLRELRLGIIGHVIATFCHVGGWFFPMYGAGRLERGNIKEYEDAARLAILAGREEFCDDLLDMAEVECDHELFFREKAAGHFLWGLCPGWDPPPPRAQIRGSYSMFRDQHATPETRSLVPGS